VVSRAADEPLNQTLKRTVPIALVVGLIVALSAGNLRAWPLTTLLALWFSFGGHWVEVGFLYLLRPFLPPARPVQIAARLGVWFLGGVGLALGMGLTARLWLGAWRAPFPAWYWGGFAFVGLELGVHLFLELRHRPSFYNGRG
jgi:hypothetical protein